VGKLILTTGTAQERAGKPVATRRDTGQKNLQPIALICTKVGNSPVLLAGVAQQAPAK
jgi:hypothetical protein